MPQMIAIKVITTVTNKTATFLFAVRICGSLLRCTLATKAEGAFPLGNGEEGTGFPKNLHNGCLGLINMIP